MKRNSKGQFKRNLSGETYCGHGVWCDHKGYPKVCINNKDEFVHVVVWEKKFGKKPEGFEIHHKDFDKSNYDISNLQLLSKSDHRKIHAGWLKPNGKWTHKPCNKCRRILPLSDFYPRKGLTPSGMCKKCHCESAAQWAAKNPEKRKEIANRYAMKKYYERKEVQNAGN